MDNDQYQKYMVQAIDLYAMAGRINQSGKCAQEIAEFFESKYDYESAAKFF